MNAKDLELDYFQIYDFNNPRDVTNTAPGIRLKGQFDLEGPEYAKLRYLSKMANPVEKNDEGFYNKDGHMVLYRMESSGDDRVIGVKLENQFGRQKIVIYRDVALMVPARKRIMKPGSKFTNRTKLDHYKIYRVVEQSDIQNMSLKLVDQFQERKVELRQMVAFAVPVHKRHCGKDFEIINEKAHLAIYRITYSKDMPQVVEMRDQFSRYRYLRVGRSYLLAAPSVKHDWKVLD